MPYALRYGSPFLQETLTHVAEQGAPDDRYLPLKEHFTEVEISDLTMVIALMNAFNRLAVGMQL